MNRKILHISLVLILVVATTGISISKHFCADRLVEVSVNNEAEPCCGTESNCCQTETEFFQIDDDFTSAIATLVSYDSGYNNDVSIISTRLSSSSCNIFSTQSVSSDLPPPQLKIPDLSLQQTYLL